ncbi:baseplate J/gp47 family protein [Pseudomonas extremaustralis]|uniref:baseplate J/gp47 family protein n=1 Tax=Pseudomonas extremaustralis TaxID=359110 RepID=UPI002306DE15|nr:baseplate J/gp47 family protein [Pseudomonas extremaustralis]MDB1109701.1 baseplate J/gp47 family protein [Pseudomonas extremaustralis]
MAFSRPTLPELIARVDNDLVSRLPGAQAVLAQRMTKALATGQAGLAHGLYGYLQWMERQLFPETCDDDLLYLHSVGVPRREESTNSGLIIVGGVNGFPLDAGTVWQYEGAEYRTTTDVVIQAGAAQVNVEAYTAGAAGELPAGAELTLISPVTGINSKAKVAAGGITGGADIEEFSTWRDRIMLRRARIPRGGAEGDWAEWALQVPGVTRAWEDPLGMGLGTVVLRIMADDAAGGPMPSLQLLQDVFDYIETQRNVTAHVYVVSCIPKYFEPRLRVTPDNSQVRSAVEKNLQDLILRTGEPGKPLSISQIRTAIGTAANLTDYDLEWPTTSVPHGHGELPLWGGAVWLA